MSKPRSAAGVLAALFLCACTVLQPRPLPATPTPTRTAAPTATATPTLTPTPTLIPTPLPETRVKTGDEAFWLGDYDTAYTQYQLAYANSTDLDTRAAGLYGMGRVAHIRGDDPGAITSLQGLLDNFPSSPLKADSYFWLGQIYSGLKRYADAAVAYAQYRALRPGVIDAYVQELIGDALAASGDDQGSIDAFQAAAQAPRLGDAFGLQLKIGQAYLRLKEYDQAVNVLNTVYTSATSDYTRADADLFAGEAYLAQDQPDQAKERLLDAVNNFPKAYSAYASLLLLVNGGLPVSDLQRGLVDYNAGQYQPALTALDRAVQSASDPDGTGLYYEALTYSALQDYTSAVSTWDEFLKKYPQNPNWASAWEDKAYAQWADLGKYDDAAATMLSFVTTAPDNARAPAALMEAGRIFEREGKLEDAAKTWDRLVSEYPTSDQTFRGLFLAGVSRFRLGNLADARASFERAYLLNQAAADQAAVTLWIGKIQQAQGDDAGAKASWQQAARLDPTGYYSERAVDLLAGRSPFTPPQQYDFGLDLAAERTAAEKWLRTTFALDAAVDLYGTGRLSGDPRFIRGTELWKLGLYDEARSEFEALRTAVKDDVINTYQLMNYLNTLGLYRSAIYASRQILNLAHMDDAATLTAPDYFNHIRFGIYFRTQILSAAQAENLDPILVLSLIRQESMFEGFATSSAGAQGLMQIMPATAGGVASNLGWPPNYSAQDLYRPVVSIRLGAHYLAQQRDAFRGDLYATLAAYNGGPGNASAWMDLSNNDPDLFLEVIRLQETRTYIMNIYEIYAIYRQLYSHAP